MTTSATAPARLPLLQQRLILSRFFCRYLGFQDAEELLKALADAALGPSPADGRSYFYHRLATQQQVLARPEVLGRLADYDTRIMGYVARLNRPISLLYFQYLAVLYTEMYLERLFQDRAGFLGELNRFVSEENKRLEPAALPYLPFSDADLNKLAFWMATGSGKTLVMHINLWQYLHYSQSHPPRNILLVTPNEGLSEQHQRELTQSGIPNRRYDEAGAGATLFGELPVTVIEITKLKKNKRGRGRSVDVSTFGSDNLLLVDEGHRGATGDEWRDLRAQVAENGFTMEYSATFGQIVNGADMSRRPGLLEEYSKAILFDYSYPHFYRDGYGKDYWLVNLKDEDESYMTWLLLGNLLSFAEQLLVYEEHTAELRPYELERPLWVFVGHSVTGGQSSQDQVSLTDVEQIVAFFASFLREPEAWADRIGQVLSGKVKGAGGNDLFPGQFRFLTARGWSPAELHQVVVERVFQGAVGESLRAAVLRAAPGEIGLRTGADRPYFGVINIGDVAGLMRRFARRGVACEEESISASLFQQISAPDSRVNVLIGSRKFMEGWDCYRVSSMGLMNIGRGEGSQIIQLFGRGVRLHGRNGTLKRSAFLERAGAPPHVRLLETLNVFGIRANYMVQFRGYLQEEGIASDFEFPSVPIHVPPAFLQAGLLVLRLPPGERFQEQCRFALRRENLLRVSVDLRPRLETARSGTQVLEAVDQVGGQDLSMELRKWAALFDWDRIYGEMMAFRQARGWYNLVFQVQYLREIIEGDSYELYCPESRFPQNGAAQRGDLRRLEDMALIVLRRYAAAVYDRRRREWEREHLQLVPLEGSDPNLNFRYELRVKASCAQRVRDLIDKADRVTRDDESRFPIVYFDRHLYQPLLVEQDEIEWMSPPGLNAGERQFVADLRRYVESQPVELVGKQVYLLRNLTQGRGVGFFESSSGETFYPDFILWVVQDAEQWIAFLDPHGLRHTEERFDDPKIKLHHDLAALEKTLRDKNPHQVVHLTSMILSTSSHAEVTKLFGRAAKDEFAANHVYFMEDAGYIERLFRALLSV